jgi:hypothetical protein
MTPSPGFCLVHKNIMGYSTSVSEQDFSVTVPHPVHFQSAFGFKQKNLS